MITLILITIPVEIIFLCILRAFGWLKLPITFAILSVLFFCCAVSFTVYPVFMLAEVHNRSSSHLSWLSY